MSKKVLIRKQAGGGGIMYTREVGGRGQGGGFMEDLAALRGGARGLVTDPNTNNVRQGFIPGAELGAAKPTGMQRLAAGANLAGRGLAAALTGLQTAYGLQGGNVGALGSVGDTYAQNVQGLTMNRPTEAQQTQDMATKEFNTQQANMAQQAMMQQATPPRQGNLTVGVAPPTHSSSSATAPAQQPTPPPAGLPTPPTSGVPPSHPGFAFSHTVNYPAATNEAGMTPPPGSQTAALSTTPAEAAQLLPPAPTGQAAPATSNPINPQAAAQMLPTVSQQPTSPTVSTGNEPQFSGPMNPPAAPVAVSQPVMPEQRHEQQRVAVRPPVATPYTPQNTVNPFAADKKPGHAYNTGQYAPTQREYGLSDKNDYRNRVLGPAFSGVEWDSAVPTLGDDPNINWTEELSKAFAMFVLNDFGDMLHKADPHVAGAVAMRVFLEKMLRK